MTRGCLSVVAIGAWTVAGLAAAFVSYSLILAALDRFADPDNETAALLTFLAPLIGLAIAFIGSILTINRLPRTKATGGLPRPAVSRDFVTDLEHRETVQGVIRGAIADDVPAWQYLIGMLTWILSFATPTAGGFNPTGTTYDLVITDRGLVLLSHKAEAEPETFLLADVHVEAFRPEAGSAFLRLRLPAERHLNLTLKWTDDAGRDDIKRLIAGLEPHS